MFCHRCGTQMPEDSLFCRMCGVALIQRPSSAPVAARASTVALPPSPPAVPPLAIESVISPLSQLPFHEARTAPSASRGGWHRRRRHRPWYRKLYLRLIPSHQVSHKIVVAVVVILATVVVALAMMRAGR